MELCSHEAMIFRDELQDTIIILEVVDMAILILSVFVEGNSISETNLSPSLSHNLDFFPSIRHSSFVTKLSTSPPNNNKYLASDLRETRKRKRFDESKNILWESSFSS